MSAPVSIVIDSEKLRHPPHGALLVERVADYPPACLALRNALQSRQQVVIVVRNRNAAAWLASYAQTYGAEEATVNRITPRDALAEAWQVTVPAHVTDADIMRSRLLEVSLTARAGQSFADLILAHFYCEILAYPTLPIVQLGALLNNYDAERWQASSARPLAAMLYKERLQEWHSKAQSASAQALIAALRDDPVGLRRDLCAYKVLRNYPPTLGAKVLGDRWELFHKTKCDADALSLATIDTTAPTEIEYYLTGIRSKITGADDVAALLGEMSGFLDAEYEFIAELLGERPEWVTLELIRSIEQRFMPLRARIGKRIATLRKLIKPAFPAEPQPDWSAERWLRWVTGSYMPYYAWLEAQDKQDANVAEYAVAFADWYYANFVSLKNGQSALFAFSALYGDRERIRAKDAVTLALMLDNFNFVHFADLCRIFQAHGMSLAAAEPRFSLIPTATEVGKAALIATTGDQIDLPTSSYPALVDKEWNNNGKNAAYLPNIGALQQLSKRDSDIYFLNFLPIDETLHQDAQEIGRTHAEVIYDHLSTVAKSVADFAQRFQLEKRLLVYVLSDHGATRIAQGVVNVLDPSFYKALADKKHHRFIDVSDEKFKGLPQSVGQQCYRIDRHQFKTNHHYLAARRYYRFLPTTDNFYVHGGLTPEEVVVPFARFTFVPVVPDPPTLALLHKEFRFAVKSRINIEVGNPNGFPLEAITVRLIDADAEEVMLEQLDAKSKTNVELLTTFRKQIGGANSRSLTVRVRYSYQGTEYTAPDREFAITMKSMMEEKNDLDDLF